MKIKRYHMWCAASHGHELLDAEDGGLVTYADYEQLERDNARLRSELEAALAAVRGVYDAIRYLHSRWPEWIKKHATTIGLAQRREGEKG